MDTDMKILVVEDEKLPFEEIRGKKHSVQIYELVRMKEQA